MPWNSMMCRSYVGKPKGSGRTRVWSQSLCCVPDGWPLAVAKPSSLDSWYVPSCQLRIAVVPIQGITTFMQHIEHLIKYSVLYKIYKTIRTQVESVERVKMCGRVKLLLVVVASWNLQQNMCIPWQNLKPTHDGEFRPCAVWCAWKAGVMNLTAGSMGWEGYQDQARSIKCTVLNSPKWAGLNMYLSRMQVWCVTRSCGRVCWFLLLVLMVDPLLHVEFKLKYV